MVLTDLHYHQTWLSQEQCQILSVQCSKQNDGLEHISQPSERFLLENRPARQVCLPLENIQAAHSSLLSLLITMQGCLPGTEHKHPSTSTSESDSSNLPGLQEMLGVGLQCSGCVHILSQFPP